jgi:EF-P beta-lysylation protein EpmB
MSAHWQTLLQQGVRDPAELIRLLNLPHSLHAEVSNNPFPLRVPRGFVQRMSAGDVNDPLLRQVLPITEEDQLTPGFITDPLQEAQYNPLPGLIHKYHGRVLLTVASACAINCRYCFRRHFPYAENRPQQADWREVLDYIAADTSITEVIFSGGDPLLADDAYLSNLINKLSAIAHVKLLRIHSRLPIVLPERITQGLITCLQQTRLQPVLVTHCNHPHEIDSQVKQALQRCQAANITLFNQAVLLKGVNDQVACLAALSQALFTCGVVPYYLHQLDKVQGAAHFHLPLSRAKSLHQQLSAQLPGYLVPKLVQEIPGNPAKTPI